MSMGFRKSKACASGTATSPAVSSASRRAVALSQRRHAPRRSSSVLRSQKAALVNLVIVCLLSPFLRVRHGLFTWSIPNTSNFDAAKDPDGIVISQVDNSSKSLNLVGLPERGVVFEKRDLPIQTDSHLPGSDRCENGGRVGQDRSSWHGTAIRATDSVREVPSGQGIEVRLTEGRLGGLKRDGPEKVGFTYELGQSRCAPARPPVGPSGGCWPFGCRGPCSGPPAGPPLPGRAPAPVGPGHHGPLTHRLGGDTSRPPPLPTF